MAHQERGHRSRGDRTTAHHTSRQQIRRARRLTRLKALLIIVASAVISLYTLMSARSDAEPIGDPAISSTVLNSASWLSASNHSANLMPFTHRGNQIILNGRALSATWSQRSQRIGLSDAGLVQAFGLNLLNTTDASRQPVQWFASSGETSPTLSSWLDGQYRYLDVTDLARQQGWNLNPAGNSLQISTPPSRVLGLRQGRQDWGDRIVLDLDRATPWQMTEQNEEVLISVDAAIDPALIQNFVPREGNQLRSLAVESRANQTLIRVRIPSTVRPYVWTVGNPARLVIDIRPNAFVERDIQWTTGLRWRQQMVNLGSAQFPVVLLELDPRQTAITLKPIWSNPRAAAGIEPLQTIAQRWQAIAAVNGGFFNRNNQLPLGAIRQDGQWISGPILNRGAIAWNDVGDTLVGRLKLDEILETSTGERFPILQLNSGYIQAGIARYTAGWGVSYTTLTDNEVLVTVENDRVVRQQVGSGAGQTTVQIPVNGYLLTLRSYRTAANSMPIGTAVSLSTSVFPPEFGRYSQILGAGPLLMQNRQIVLNPQLEQFSDAFIGQRAPRSAIATTGRGTLMIAVAHNRVNGSGPSLTEMAQIMQRLDAVNALNLDGGSSTTLYLGGQVLNRPPRTVARVHNGIGIFIQPNL